MWREVGDEVKLVFVFGFYLGAISEGFRAEVGWLKIIRMVEGLGLSPPHMPCSLF